MFLQQPIPTTIVQVVPPPTREVGVLDVLLGSLGLTGLIVLASLLLGALLGALIIGLRRWQADRPGARDSESGATRLDLSSR